MSATPTPRRWLVLAVVCLAAFAINLDTTIVNVALPQLTSQLHATTRDLQWIVDGYNLSFAALVLAAGSLSDRFGRRPALITGLLLFAAGSAAGALCQTSGELIVARTAMGAAAALIYPTTLSVITNAFPVRSERAAAIGVWGGVTGLGVAIGPVTGGALLEHFWWGSIFVALVPVALLAAAASYAVVPESRDRRAPRIDVPGLVLSTATITLLVYTVIEAPARGWASAATLGGFALCAALGIAFIRTELRVAEPMLDVSLFRNPAFSAASGSVTVAFFALFGFIFLITQYLQITKGYGALSTGVRMLPVAGSIAVSSVVGARLAPRIGTRRIVTVGLLLFGAAFLWVAAVAEPRTSYLTISLEMLVMGTGLGLTTAPATESILTVLPAAKAGVGSAVNDATREVGGTLGVAVIGSVYSSVYVNRLAGTAVDRLPHGLAVAARSSVGAATQIAHSAPGPAGRLLSDAVTASFLSGLHVACVVVAAVCWAGAAGAAAALPGRRSAAQIRLDDGLAASPPAPVTPVPVG